MSTERFEWERALLASDLPAMARLIGFALATRTDSDLTIPAQYTPSLSTIGKWTGLSGTAVKKYLNVLEVTGWVRRIRPTVVAARMDHERTQYSLATPKAARTPGDLGRDATMPRSSHDQGLGRVATEARSPRDHKPSRSITEPSHASTAAAPVDFEDLRDDADEAAFLRFHNARSHGFITWAKSGGVYADKVREYRAGRAPQLATTDQRVIDAMNLAQRLAHQDGTPLQQIGA
ncbi:hypothetical protein [Georgenia yuyongxinii]